MFAPEEFLSLEHTAHPKLFESQKYVWDALKQIASYLQFRLKPAVLGDLVGKPFISNAVFVGAGTIVEQGAVLKGPAWIGENCHIRSGCYVRENVIVGDGVVMGNSCEFKNCILFDEAQVPALQLRRGLHSGLSRASRRGRDSLEREAGSPGDSRERGGWGHRDGVDEIWRDRRGPNGDRLQRGDQSGVGAGPGLPGLSRGEFRGVLPNASVVKVRQKLQVLTRRAPNAG